MSFPRASISAPNVGRTQAAELLRQLASDIGLSDDDKHRATTGDACTSNGHARPWHAALECRFFVFPVFVYFSRLINTNTIICMPPCMNSMIAMPHALDSTTVASTQAAGRLSFSISAQQIWNLCRMSAALATFALTLFSILSPWRR